MTGLRTIWGVSLVGFNLNLDKSIMIIWWNKPRNFKWCTWLKRYFETHKRGKFWLMG
jgi:hypothetical protein